MSFALFALTACSNNNNTQEETPQPNQTLSQTPDSTGQSILTNDGFIRHQFETLGFSVELPASWEGKVSFIELEFDMDFGTRNFVEVYHIATREELGFGGTLFSLGRSPRDHYTYEGERPVMSGGMIFLAQTDGVTYFVSFPSGVEHSEAEGSTSAAEFLEMIGHYEPNHWNFLLDSFQLLP